MSTVSRETVPDWVNRCSNPGGLIAYHDILADAGVQRGLIGPREVPRLWDRHLGNCAAVVIESSANGSIQPRTDIVGSTSRVADIGSGAGLPGLVWSLVRPDLRVCLVEPLLRRATFLSETVSILGLDHRVEVVRSRAEDMPAGTVFDVVTARAVAPLERLSGWTLPLVAPGGRMVALKGASAEEERVRAEDAIRRSGGGGSDVRQVGQGLVETPTTVVVVERADES